MQFLQMIVFDVLCEGGRYERYTVCKWIVCVMYCVRVDGVYGVLCEGGWYVTVCCVQVDGMCDVLCESGWCVRCAV
jgi:hypothetical protein